MELHERYGGIAMPAIEIADLKKEMALKEMVHNFTSVLREHIAQSLEAGKQFILFQNRRGYAPFLLCNTAAGYRTANNAMYR